LLDGTPDEQVLRLSLRFYGAERCGDTGNWIIADHPLGGTCHVQDGQSAGLDLSGGWHDAGDHVKVTLTIAYAAYLMLKAYDVYPNAFDDLDGPDYAGVPNGVPDVLDEARFGLDWLVKAHPDPNTLVAMVANADYDHETFVTSPYQSTVGVTSGGDPRPVQMGGAADFAGLASAALALASRVYAPYDSAVAATYLEKARSAYAYGQANPGLSDSQLYAWMGTNWEDDMLCAAAELYVATSEAQYLSDAQSWNLDMANYPRTYWVASYGQVADFGRHTLVDAGESAALGPWQDEVDDYRASVSSDPDLSGLVYYDQWGTCRYALSAAFSAALLYEVTADTTYRDFSLSQYEWVKGNNPYGRSFIVGWGTNPPQRPHHRNAFGHDDTLGFDDPSDPQMDNGIPFEHVLWGALVGGPTPADGYADDMNDYQRNEVAIDYNAGLVGSAAFAVALERAN
jgi:endoglucanase